MPQALSATDSYKLSHKGFMEDNTQFISANLTPRSDKHFKSIKGYDRKVVVYGLQAVIKDVLINEWNITFFKLPKEQAIRKFKRLVDAYLGPNAVSMEHFEELHDLGYLPVRIKALPEGSRVNLRVPMYTIKNTHKNFAWLTNYLETVLSASLWKPCTVATIISEYRRLINEFAMKTTGSLDFTMFQAHDFSFRGMPNRQDAAFSGSAFLLSSCGTDTIPALDFIEEYYNTDITQTFIATSVPATEHSIQCSGTAVRGEFEAFKKWITIDYPTGIVSLVSDGYDYWHVITNYIPRLKEIILNRPVNALDLSKVVIRPDSGNPADIICGEQHNWTHLADADELNDFIIDSVDGDKFVYNGLAYEVTGKQDFINSYGWENPGNLSDIVHLEHNTTIVSQASVDTTSPAWKGSIELLWEIFGGTVTEQGYKVLDSHIGLIYGDSITLELAEEIFTKLAAKGFASTNVVLGVGSYTMQYMTRDTFGMAVKATHTVVDEVGYELFKDPVTDTGLKKSAKGLLRVEREGNDFVLYDQQTPEQEEQGVLETVFENGVLVKETTFTEIRARLWG
jgi:nicotinamide phosphoribosyltransferase